VKVLDLPQDWPPGRGACLLTRGNGGAYCSTTNGAGVTCDSQGPQGSKGLVNKGLGLNDAD